MTITTTQTVAYITNLKQLIYNGLKVIS